MIPGIENEFLRKHPLAAAEELEKVPDEGLAALLDGLDPAALAAAEELEKVPDEGLAALLDGLDPAALAVAMEYLSPPRALAVFSALARETQRDILERAAPRLAVTLLADREPAERDAVLAELTPSSRQDLKHLLSFPDDSAGRLMDRSFVTVSADMTAGEVLTQLRKSSVRGARAVFVVGADSRLEGRVDIQDIALGDADETIGKHVQAITETVTAQANREELVDLLERSRKDSVPVVDADGRLAGVVRYRNLFHAIEDVATADIQKMVGVSPEERALSLPGFAIKRRLPWLHINLVTAFLAASVVGLFESLIAQFTALAVLLPVVAGQSGNAGAQALAVTMRGLALREIGVRQWRSVLNKEVIVGLINGFALAVTCGLAVFVWSQSLGLALVIAVAMVMSMLAAGIAGSLVPVILTRLGQDPATASSIILTTITDVAGFFSFLGTATLLAFML